jgi:hypothetical protein
VLGYGGVYTFTNCTVVSYTNSYISNAYPVLNISNTDSTGTQTADMNASFVNCIFWGGGDTVTNEVVASRQGSSLFNINFSNCLWKVSNVPANVSASNMLNVDPMFDSVNNQNMYYNFHLKSGSPAIGAGIFTGIPFDLDGNPRSVGNATDIGCYEKQP